MFIDKNYKSWYDLSYDEAYKLEKEFISDTTICYRKDVQGKIP